MAMEILGFASRVVSTFKDDKAPGSGTHRSADAASWNSIKGALVPAIIIALAYLAAFITIRPWFPSQYSPRTFFQTIPEKDRTPSTSRTSLGWLRDFWRFDDSFILRHHSFDAYLFLRFFRVMILISYVGCCLTWPILFPLNATGGGNAKQLDRIAFGNITDSSRLWGHAFVACLFLTFIVLLITRERVFLIGFRQAYLTTAKNSHRLSSRTVVFLSPPAEIEYDESSLERLFDQTIQRSWIIADFKRIQDLVSERNGKIFELELAELKLAQNVTQQMRKVGHKASTTDANDAESASNDRTVDSQQRPSHRKPPLVGKKLDTIDQILESLPDIDASIQKARERYEAVRRGPIRALVVEFQDQIAAHRVLQQAQHHSPFLLQPRYINVPPKDIIWSNLTLDLPLRITYSYIAIAVFIATIILWSIPVGIVGTISNIDYLTNKIKWLGFINRLPGPVLSFIKGFIPPYLLSLLVSYVPDFFRYVATISGAPTAEEVERTTQIWYFVFQVLQVFLITTFSSGAATIVTRIANRPGTIPDFLAKNLPLASNFYLTYFIIQGLGSSTQLLIKYTDLFQYLFFSRFWDKTPRQKYERETKTKGLFMGKLFPKFANMAVIAITYSCIAPLVLGFATIGLTLFYLTYRYLFLYANNAKLDTKGACYARALQQLLTGVYLSELCLIGLFGAREAKGPSILMVVVLILTIIQHLAVNKYLRPLEQFMPLDVLHDAGQAGRSPEQADPLLSSSSGSRRLSSSSSSYRRRTTLGLPSFLSRSPLSLVLPSHLLPSASVLRPYLTDPASSSSDDEPPQYTDTQLKNAYLPPALTSKAPVVWLASDSYGVATDMATRNKDLAGLETSIGPEDEVYVNKESARLEMKGVLRDFRKAPVFKEPVVF